MNEEVRLDILGQEIRVGDIVMTTRRYNKTWDDSNYIVSSRVSSDMHIAVITEFKPKIMNIVFTDDNANSTKRPEQVIRIAQKEDYLCVCGWCGTQLFHHDTCEKEYGESCSVEKDYIAQMMHEKEMIEHDFQNS